MSILKWSKNTKKILIWNKEKNKIFLTFLKTLLNIKNIRVRTNLWSRECPPFGFIEKLTSIYLWDCVPSIIIIIRERERIFICCKEYQIIENRVSNPQSLID